MRKLGRFAVGLLKREDGPTTLQWALLLALVVAGCVGAIVTFDYLTRDTLHRSGSSAAGR
jgi:hypothetical protein